MPRIERNSSPYIRLSESNDPSSKPSTRSSKAQTPPDGLSALPRDNAPEVVQTRRRVSIGSAHFNIGMTTWTTKTAPTPDDAKAPHGMKQKIRYFSVELNNPGGKRHELIGLATEKSEPRKGQPGPVRAALNRLFGFS